MLQVIHWRLSSDISIYSSKLPEGKRHKFESFKNAGYKNQSETHLFLKWWCNYEKKVKTNYSFWLTYPPLTKNL